MKVFTSNSPKITGWIARHSAQIGVVLMEGGWLVRFGAGRERGRLDRPEPGPAFAGYPSKQT